MYDNSLRTSLFYMWIIATFATLDGCQMRRVALLKLEYGA